MNEHGDHPGLPFVARPGARLRLLVAVVALIAIGLFAGASAFASRPYLPSPPRAPASIHQTQTHADDPNPDHC